ncbi:hypothetical protein Tco_0099934 [Tanacetum coccineum]
MHSLFQGGMQASRTSASGRYVEGRSKGGDGVGSGMGRSGGVLDGGASYRGDRSGSGWEVDGALTSGCGSLQLFYP